MKITLMKRKIKDRFGKLPAKTQHLMLIAEQKTTPCSRS